MKVLKIVLGVFVILFLGIVIHIGIIYFSYLRSYTDTKNYTITGFVFDNHTKMPLAKAMLNIKNNISGQKAYLHDTYTEIQNLTTYTDEKGYYARANSYF